MNIDHDYTSIPLAPHSHKSIDGFNFYLNHILASSDYCADDCVKYSNLAASDEDWLNENLEAMGYQFPRTTKELSSELINLLKIGPDWIGKGQVKTDSGSLVYGIDISVDSEGNHSVTIITKPDTPSGHVDNCGCGELGNCQH